MEISLESNWVLKMRTFVYFMVMGAAILLSLLPIIACGQQRKLEKKSDKEIENKIERIILEQSSSVSETLNTDIPTIRQIVIGLFTELRKRREEEFGYFDVCAKESQIFPEDIQMQATISDNKAIADYLKLTPSDREQDLYVYNVSGDYWFTTDEYHCNGESAKFQSNFVIHLNQKNSNQTVVEIIQYLPSIWCGKEFDEQGRHGAGWINNIKRVSPTIKESKDLLKIIATAVKNN